MQFFVQIFIIYAVTTQCKTQDDGEISQIQIIQLIRNLENVLKLVVRDTEVQKQAIESSSEAIEPRKKEEIFCTECMKSCKNTTFMKRITPDCRRSLCPAAACSFYKQKTFSEISAAKNMSSKLKFIGANTLTKRVYFTSTYNISYNNMHAECCNYGMQLIGLETNEEREYVLSITKDFQERNPSMMTSSTKFYTSASYTMYSAWVWCDSGQRLMRKDVAWDASHSLKYKNKESLNVKCATISLTNEFKLMEDECSQLQRFMCEGSLVLQCNPPKCLKLTCVKDVDLKKINGIFTVAQSQGFMAPGCSSYFMFSTKKANVEAAAELCCKMGLQLVTILNEIKLQCIHTLYNDYVLKNSKPEEYKEFWTSSAFDPCSNTFWWCAERVNLIERRIARLSNLYHGIGTCMFLQFDKTSGGMFYAADCQLTKYFICEVLSKSMTSKVNQKIDKSFTRMENILQIIEEDRAKKIRDSAASQDPQQNYCTECIETCKDSSIWNEELSCSRPSCPLLCNKTEVLLNENSAKKNVSSKKFKLLGSMMALTMYFGSTAKLTYHEAFKECCENGMRLVSLETALERAHLYLMVTSKYTTHTSIAAPLFWSSATNTGIDKVWGWCGSNKLLTDEVGWEGKGAVLSQHRDMCGMMNPFQEMYLREEQCDTQANFICEAKIAPCEKPECPNLYCNNTLTLAMKKDIYIEKQDIGRMVSGCGSYYFFAATSVNFETAIKQCCKRGLKLVTILTEEKFKCLTQIYKEKVGKYIYVGTFWTSATYNECSRKMWWCQNSVEVNATKLLVNSKSPSMGDCLYYNIVGLLGDTSYSVDKCSKSYQFICEIA